MKLKFKQTTYRFDQQIETKYIQFPYQKMQLNKRISENSFTQASQSYKSSLLVLKKSFSQQLKDQIVFDFSNPLIQEESQNWSVSQMVPIFNKDRKFYTPTFILKMDQLKYCIRDFVYRSLHNERIQLDTCESSQLYIAKPHKCNFYCIVCQHNFQDYQKHIITKIHVQKMNRSPFSHDIKQLCEKFGNFSQISSINVQKIRKMKIIKKMSRKLKNRCEIDTKMSEIIDQNDSGDFRNKMKKKYVKEKKKIEVNNWKFKISKFQQVRQRG